jgi:hypothetical protein
VTIGGRVAILLRTLQTGIVVSHLKMRKRERNALVELLLVWVVYVLQTWCWWWWWSKGKKRINGSNDQKPRLDFESRRMTMIMERRT